MTESTRSGACYCGAVRFRIALPPLWVAHCHCSICRRVQAAPFTTWVGSATDRFVLEVGEDCLVRYASTPPAVRSFCGRCGTPLFFESARRPGEIHVTLPSFESAEGLEPQAHAYWSDRVPWVHIGDDGLPRL